MLLKNQRITRRNQTGDKKKYLEKNENTMLQKLWDVSKAVIREKFMAIQSYLKKQEKYQININININKYKFKI